MTHKHILQIGCIAFLLITFYGSTLSADTHPQDHQDSKTNLSQQFYDLMGYEIEINKILDRISDISAQRADQAKLIRQEYRDEVTSRIERLYSEEELEQLIAFFNHGVGKSYRAKQKEMFSSHSEFLMHLLNKNFNTEAEGDKNSPRLESFNGASE